jgi:signal peptidase I
MLATLRHNDDDILSGKAKAELDALVSDGRMALAAGADQPAAYLNDAPARLSRIMAHQKHRVLREWLDIIAVALAVAFGIRGLFLQPFKIPTSSMQPTLYGIHFIDGERKVNPLLGKIPEPLETLLFSTRRAELTVAGSGGTVDPDSFDYRNGPLFGSTSFRIGDQGYSLPGVPNKVVEYSGLEPHREYRPGERLVHGFLSLGDHLFVDRVSHNLTGLARGDIVVFNTEGIVSAGGRRLMDDSGYYYIKRLVGLPGDRLRLVDRNLYVKPAGETEFRHIKTFSPAFEKIYSGQGGYQGHLPPPDGYILSRQYPEYTVPADCYFMLGDNSTFSADSRYWGVVPRRNIVGRALVVFWPFSRRWGAADRAGALEAPTGEAVRGTFPSMYLQ